VEDSLIWFLAEPLSRLAEVEQIFVRREDPLLRIWVVLPDYQVRTEEALFDWLEHRAKAVPGLDLDLSIIYRKGRDGESLAPPGSRRVYCSPGSTGSSGAPPGPDGGPSPPDSA
jgi:hypothetical protein